MGGAPLRFGTDGVRGRANTELTPEFALSLGRAAARVLSPPLAVVGGDSRLSTPMLEAAFVAGLATEGVDVVRIGVAPTPAVAFEAAERSAMGAVVSASHNPYHDNGIKLFAVGGRKLPDEIEQAIEDELERVATQPANTDEAGAIHGRTDPEPYVEHLLSVLDGRRLESLAVVVDAANGAASYVVREVFERTGATVTIINDQPNGRNINAGCGATDPAALCKAVVALGADVGIALDGDADRLIAVDATGAVVDGDEVIAMCALDMAARGVLHHNTVVVTVMTNLGFRNAMAERGIAVVETAVGDRYVLEALNGGGYSLGGEQSGHVIFADRASTGDGMLTALALLDVIARTQRPLQALAAESMTKLPQVLVNVALPANAPTFPELQATLADEIAAVEQRLDGTGRILVRPSGTEPLVRVMVEAGTAPDAQNVANDVAALFRARFG